MPKKVRLGLVGSGGMAKAHLPYLTKMEGVEITAFCDPMRYKADKLAAEHHAKAFDTPAEMLDSVEMDALYLLLPPFAHGEPEREAIERKIPFFIEKPIGLDLALTREIAQEVERQKIISCAGYMNRYRKSLHRGRELLQNDPAALVFGGWIGGSPSPQPGDDSIKSWWVQKSTSGGQIVEQCTHTFDVLRYLCGEAVEVFAHGAHGFNKNVYMYDIDDASTVNILLKSGGVANLMSTCAANGGGGGVSLNLYSHDTTLQYTGWEHSVVIRRKGVEGVEEIKGEPDIFGVEDEVFISAVRTGDASAIQSPYPDAARTLELTLAANKSLETGKPVSISAS